MEGSWGIALRVFQKHSLVSYLIDHHTIWGFCSRTCLLRFLWCFSLILGGYLFPCSSSDIEIVFTNTNCNQKDHLRAWIMCSVSNHSRNSSTCWSCRDRDKEIPHKNPMISCSARQMPSCQAMSLPQISQQKPWSWLWCNLSLSKYI